MGRQGQGRQPLGARPAPRPAERPHRLDPRRPDDPLLHRVAPRRRRSRRAASPSSATAWSCGRSPPSCPRPRRPPPTASSSSRRPRASPPHDVGGPYALAISARSDIFQEFEGGPGQIAIHGTNGLSDPLGSAASHGCIRLRRAPRARHTWLAQAVPRRSRREGARPNPRAWKWAPPPGVSSAEWNETCARRRCTRRSRRRIAVSPSPASGGSRPRATCARAPTGDGRLPRRPPRRARGASRAGASAWRRPTARGCARSRTARTRTRARAGRPTARRSRSSPTAQPRAAPRSTRSRRASWARRARSPRRLGSSSTTSGRPTAPASCCSSPATAPSRPTRSARARSAGGRAAGLDAARRLERGRGRAAPVALRARRRERRAAQASPDEDNVWEAAWCGDRAVVAIVSEGAGEGAWYGAELALIDPAARTRARCGARVQLGWASGSPGGTYAAVVEAVCSDRVIVAGELLLIDPASGEARAVDTHGVDVTWTAWRDDERLLAIGVRGLEPVALDVAAATARPRRSGSATGPAAAATTRRHRPSGPGARSQRSSRPGIARRRSSCSSTAATTGHGRRPRARRHGGAPRG